MRAIMKHLHKGIYTRLVVGFIEISWETSLVCSCVKLKHSVQAFTYYYLIIFIDCMHMKIHRKRSVKIESFYAMLAVHEDKRRKVLGILDKLTGSALGWGKGLTGLHK